MRKVEFSVARRKYCTLRVANTSRIHSRHALAFHNLSTHPHDWQSRKGKLGKSPAAALFRIYLITKTTKHPQKKTVYVYETNSSERERTCFILPIITYRRRHHTIWRQRKRKASKKQQNKQQLHIDSNRITAIGLRSNRI